ncbi:MAG TPA: hypothetical protein VH682_22830 [Gemmataceae bacterium]|jgi:hypothetical protein
MRATLVCLAVMLIVPHIEAAPVPDPGRVGKAKLEELKKKLPDIFGEWKKVRAWRKNGSYPEPELRVLRRIGPERAKAVLLFPHFGSTGNRVPRHDMLLTIFLCYQDGYWTTERFETFGAESHSYERSDFAFLMLAIDEAAEKP